MDSSLDLIRTAAAAKSAVLVAVDAEKIALLERELGQRNSMVEFAPMGEVGRNPGRIISVWNDFAERYAGAALVGIGEPVWPAGTPAELLECQQHEHLLNHAFAAAGDFFLRYLYHASALSPDVLAEARRSHPLLHDATGPRASDACRIASVDDLLGTPLTPRPADATTTEFSGPDLGRMRALLRDQASVMGMPSDRTADLVVAISELAANSVMYAGAGELRLWASGEELVCEVHDRGRIDDPLVGRRRPGSESITGRGLWLVHELAQLVQLRSGESGTTVRVTFAAT